MLAPALLPGVLQAAHGLPHIPLGTPLNSSTHVWTAHMLKPHQLKLKSSQEERDGQRTESGNTHSMSAILVNKCIRTEDGKSTGEKQNQESKMHHFHRYHTGDFGRDGPQVGSSDLASGP